MADTAPDVRLNYPIDLWVGNQRDRPVNVFKERVSPKLLCAHEVGRVQLVLVKVVRERLEHVGLKAYVA